MRFFFRASISRSISSRSLSKIESMGLMTPSCSLSLIHRSEKITANGGRKAFSLLPLKHSAVAASWRNFLSAHSLTNITFTNAMNAPDGLRTSAFHIALWHWANNWRARSLVGFINANRPRCSDAPCASLETMFFGESRTFNRSYF
ncbi:MAG: hypothetical protein ACREDM_15855 [Methylocella sp.]